jgi:hypothetical protein
MRVFPSPDRCFPWLIRARARARNRNRNRARARETPFDYEHEHHPPRRTEHEHVQDPKHRNFKTSASVSVLSVSSRQKLGSRPTEPNLRSQSLSDRWGRFDLHNRFRLPSPSRLASQQTICSQGSPNVTRKSGLRCMISSYSQPSIAAS